MNVWLLASLALMVAGLVPALLLASRGPAAHRLVGMELAGAISVLVLVLLSQAVDQPSYLIVPLVVALLSFAGTLVFTRLLAPGKDDR